MFYLVSRAAARSNKTKYCDQCDYVTNRRANLKSHKASKHKGVRYRWHNCEYSAIRSDRLKQHKKIKHEASKGAHFLKVSELHYKQDTNYQTFYHEFRSAIYDNLKKRGHKVGYLNDKELDADETMSPTFEETIVLWCLEKIDSRLPMHVNKTFGHKMTGNTTLKDLQITIFRRIPGMLQDLNDAENNRASVSQLTIDDDDNLPFTNPGEEDDTFPASGKVSDDEILQDPGEEDDTFPASGKVSDDEMLQDPGEDDTFPASGEVSDDEILQDLKMFSEGGKEVNNNFNYNYYLEQCLWILRIRIG